jgi:hypothetical protein
MREFWVLCILSLQANSSSDSKDAVPQDLATKLAPWHEQRILRAGKIRMREQYRYQVQRSQTRIKGAIASSLTSLTSLLYLASTFYLTFSIICRIPCALFRCGTSSLCSHAIYVEYAVEVCGVSTRQLYCLLRPATRLKRRAASQRRCDRRAWALYGHSMCAAGNNVINGLYMVAVV